MSFISKLLRKHELEEITGEPEKSDLSEQLAEAVAEASEPVDAQTEPVDAQTEPVETQLESADTQAEPSGDVETVPADGEAAPDTTEDEGDDAWWKNDTAPAEALILPLEPAEPAEAAVQRRAGDDTQPLDAMALRDGETADLPETGRESEESGTRPLTAADVPTLVQSRSRRGLACAALRDVGRIRQTNQDSVLALTTTLPRESGDVTMGLFVVADGMGGHHGGEVASRLAISNVAHYVLAELVVPALTDGNTEALQPLIVAAVQEANRAIWEHAQLIGSDMGTTCTVALLLGRALYIGHVGDSRAYLAMPTGLRQLTDDHSTVGRLIKLGQLDPSEAREHPLRSQLYRTVGQQPEVQVDFGYQQLADATHLLVCSDGLWGMLDDEVMFDVIEHALWPQDACHELIARANLAGGDDNITAIVVSLPASSQ